MQDKIEGAILDGSSRERLVFPAWTHPSLRQAKQRRKRLLLACTVGLVAGVVVIAKISHISHLEKESTDAVLGMALSPEVVTWLGLPRSSRLARPTVFSSRNPWRGAGRRHRSDLLSSVSGCGGNFRPSLGWGDHASLFYAVRGPNGTADATRDASTVDVVIGSGQVGYDLDDHLVGMCAGETVSFWRDGLFFVVHVARVGPRPRVEHDIRFLEQLATVLKAIPGKRHQACTVTCSRSGLNCHERGFRIVNSCPRLREIFPCQVCETAAAGSAGPDMPCYVERSAPQGHPRGFCMVNPNIETSTCKAKYAHTRRLCPCVPQDFLHQPGR